jgi:hypothetical protein
MLDMGMSGLMSGEGKRVILLGMHFAPFLDSTTARGSASPLSSLAELGNQPGHSWHVLIVVLMAEELV